MTREELRDRVCVLLGGRVAEEIACDDISTGAEDDFAHATEMARQMVCRFGMSDALGPVTFADGATARPPWSVEPAAPSPSEETPRRIDAEVSAIVDASHTRARETLDRRRDVLDVIARMLLERETLQGTELEAIVRERSVSDAGPAPCLDRAHEPAAPDRVSRPAALGSH